MRWRNPGLFGLVLALSGSALLAACSASEEGPTEPEDTTRSASTPTDGGPGVAPIDGLTATEIAAFYTGMAEFEKTVSDRDGLGPLFTEASCAGCHTSAARGPGATFKMAVVKADGITPLDDQSLLPFGNTQHPNLVGGTGARTPILVPFEGTRDLGGSTGVVSVRVTKLLGPPLFGRGYLEAISDAEIERMAAQQAARTDGIRGRINRLPFISQPNPDSTFDAHRPGDTVIGRFGLKARIATLDEFSADALQADMGLTSPMRPAEFANPDGLADDLKPGVDVSAEQMNARASFTRLLAIPGRAPGAMNGRAWFENCSCNVCHEESLHTRADYPVRKLADIDVAVFTDMLIHDMGDGLSDSIAHGNEGMATSRDWRTAPLIGMRFNTTFMHDGRATNLRDAILMHDTPGSESTPSAQCFERLAPKFQQQILDFVGAL